MPEPVHQPLSPVEKMGFHPIGLLHANDLEQAELAKGTDKLRMARGLKRKRFLTLGGTMICKLHNIELVVGTARIKYGLSRRGNTDLIEAFIEARNEKFPNANSTVAGGCVFRMGLAENQGS